MVDRISAAEQELRKNQQQLEAFFSQSLADFFFITLDQPVYWSSEANGDELIDSALAHRHVIKVNCAMLSLYGVSWGGSDAEADSSRLLRLLGHDRDFLRELFTNSRLHVEHEAYRQDGKKLWIEGDYICMHDTAGAIVGYFGIQHDISERRVQTLTLQHQATHDTLTNLPNRMLLYDRLIANHNKIPARAKQPGLAAHRPG